MFANYWGNWFANWFGDSEDEAPPTEQMPFILLRRRRRY